MKKIALLITLFFVSYGIKAQEIMNKIELKEGSINNIKHIDLNIDTFFQVYDNKSEAHLIGDMYLKVVNDGEPIAEFYISKSTKEYYTKIYKNYLLTFKLENNHKYLIIEQAQFGKAFALSSNGFSTIGNENDSIEIEIIDFIHEWGYDEPLGDGNSSYFDDVQYTLRLKTRDVEKSFSFYSSEIKDDFTLDLEGYSIKILSELYKDSLSLIEMIINKK